MKKDLETAQKIQRSFTVRANLQDIGIGLKIDFARTLDVSHHLETIQQIYNEFKLKFPNDEAIEKSFWYRNQRSKNGLAPEVLKPLIHQVIGRLEQIIEEKKLNYLQLLESSIDYVLLVGEASQETYFFFISNIYEYENNRVHDLAIILETFPWGLQFPSFRHTDFEYLNVLVGAPVAYRGLLKPKQLPFYADGQKYEIQAFYEHDGRHNLENFKRLLYDFGSEPFLTDENLEKYVAHWTEKHRTLYGDFLKIKALLKPEHHQMAELLFFNFGHEFGPFFGEEPYNLQAFKSRLDSIVSHFDNLSALYTRVKTPNDFGAIFIRDHEPIPTSEATLEATKALLEVLKVNL